MIRVRMRHLSNCRLKSHGLQATTWTLDYTSPLHFVKLKKNDETNQTNPVWLRQSNLYNSNWNAMRTKTNYTKWTHWSLIEPNPPKTYTSNQLNIFPSQPFGPRYWSRLSLQSHLGAVLPTMPAANKKQPTDPRYAYIYMYIYIRKYKTWYLGQTLNCMETGDSKHLPIRTCSHIYWIIYIILSTVYILQGVFASPSAKSNLQQSFRWRMMKKPCGLTIYGHTSPKQPIELAKVLTV